MHRTMPDDLGKVIDACIQDQMRPKDRALPACGTPFKLTQVPRLKRHMHHLI